VASSRLSTDAIVLHGFDYLESSRIFRLLTRDGGVRSVVARGARRSKRRFGSVLDLYVQGRAELTVKEGRDLDTLEGFDLARARTQVAASPERFTGASVIAELILRTGGEAGDASLFEVVAAALDAITEHPVDAVPSATLGGAWQILVELGHAPLIDQCAECQAPIGREDAVRFHPRAGGALCAKCGAAFPAARTLPSAARAALRAWMTGETHMVDGDLDFRAHQRLLREFVTEHFTTNRPLRAFEVWEHGWDAGTSTRRHGT
jgi:DNA repair protein RecO (recombination protein O)